MSEKKKFLGIVDQEKMKNFLTGIGLGFVVGLLGLAMVR